MPSRILQLDDIRNINTPGKITSLFTRLGYNTIGDQLSIEQLELPPSITQTITHCYLIANQGNSELQIILFQLDSWTSPGVVSGKMKAIARHLLSRPTHFLLLATHDYHQIMLVNPRIGFDSQKNIKTTIRKLLIDRQNPTNYDREKLEELKVNQETPQQLYQKHCNTFDVERLTKQFYTGYYKLFLEVQKIITKHNPELFDSVTLYQFTQKLLGRIMFLYFLQKKEFLGSDRSFLKKQYQRLLKNHIEPEGNEYYSTILEPLFFEILNQDRPNLTSSWGKIPYLNGGLFEKDYDHQVIIPNYLFDPLSSDSILGFFNSYNFTIAENVPGDEDIAVDPEMLGKVFENLLAQEERSQSGTFYTPRDIVEFICIEVISKYLADQTNIPSDKICQMIEDDLETSNLELTKQEVKLLNQALSRVKILDPAVGSGAFPLGMLQILIKIKQVIAKREGMTIQRGSLTISKWKREIIANNLYGVDIKPTAIDIAKLRMWLSLIVDIPEIEDVEPLPNLDYKLMCGDSLISTIYGEELIPAPSTIKQGVLAVTPIQIAIAPLLALHKEYYEVSVDSRPKLKAEILDAEKEVFRIAINDKRNYYVKEQEMIEDRIKKLKKTTKGLTEESAKIKEKLDKLDRILREVESGEKSLNFFLYYLHFREVFDQGGFDIAIGNPPYVRQEQIKDLKPNLQLEYECYDGKADLYVYFYELGVRLLKDQGYLGYVTSNKYFRSGYGKKLREFLVGNGCVELIIDFGDANVFEAIAYPCIVVIKKDVVLDHQTPVLTWEPNQPVDKFGVVFKENSFLIAQKHLTPDGWKLEGQSVLRLLDKLRMSGTPLGEYVDNEFYRGIVTGLNEAFIVDRTMRDQLIAEDGSSREILKPLIRGRDVKRWSINYQDLWLIFTKRGIDINKYPAILNHLNNMIDDETKIKPRGYKWYELQASPKETTRFEAVKIVYPDISKDCCFTLDDSHLFLDCTLFSIPNGSHYLLGVLNSIITGFFLGQICHKIQHNYIRFKSIYTTQISIPLVSQSDRLAIENLVQQCLEAKGNNVTEYELEIDDRVASLYGLTPEEMKIIRDRG